MTAGDLSTLIVQRLARDNGGGTGRWRRVLGELRVYSRSTHAHCNWDVRPTGSVSDVAAVERTADALRLAYPFVDEPA